MKVTSFEKKKICCGLFSNIFWSFECLACEKPELHAVYWNVEQRCRQYTRNIWYYAVPHHWMFLVAIFKSTFDIICGNYDTSAWDLPFRMSLPFNIDSVLGWFLSLFIQLNTSITYVLIMIPVTTYFMSCCLYLQTICDHFDMLIDTVKNNVEINQMEKNIFKYKKRELQIKEHLCHAIKIHCNVYE